MSGINHWCDEHNVIICPDCFTCPKSIASPAFQPHFITVDEALHEETCPRVSHLTKLANRYVQVSQ